MQTHLLKNFAPRGGPRGLMAPWMRRARSALAVLGLFAVSVLVVSCGGGGGGDGSSAGLSPQGVSGASPQIVSGVAATGAPMAGGQVSIRDSSSVRNETVGDIDANGAFAIDVAGMTAPFILKATGTVDGVSRTLFSFADKPGTANVNPLTNAAVANAAGVDDPAELFDKSDSATLDKVKSVMPTSMQAAITNLQSQLKPLLDEFSAGNINPVNDAFAANHEGLDGMLDNVKVALTAGALTITNVDTGAVLFSARVKDLEHGRFTNKHEDLPRQGHPRPAAPTGVTTVGGPGPDQVTVSWDPVPGATSYDLFFTTKSKAADDEDDEGEDSKKRVKNVTSPFVVTGLDPSATYYFILRARIDGRKGPRSAKVAGSPSSTTPSSTTTTTTTTTTTAPATSTTAATSSTTAAPTTTTAAPTTTTAAPTTTTAAPTTTTAAPTTTTAAPTTTTAAPTTTTAAPTTTTAAPTTTTAAPTTTTTTTTSTTTTTTLAQVQLVAWGTYDAYCSTCHGLTGKVGRTATQISSAISSNRGEMGMLVSTSGCDSCHGTPPGTTGPLTAAQIAAIAARTLPRP